MTKNPNTDQYNNMITQTEFAMYPLGVKQILVESVFNKI